ncbi:unnamed protein product [Miscanthus lutarioriparius]|uniref:Uncharacterized protein n=1 Tax=Miscanthus lutarioriparius TaxID=422564 RepID=A0A811QZB8_9POAL|nr:unnamed protein product [Miscanthus lutarioriparius]
MASSMAPPPQTLPSHPGHPPPPSSGRSCGARPGLRHLQGLAPHHHRPRLPRPLPRVAPDGPRALVSTTSFRPSDADHRRCHALDCRHGRAVFYDYGSLQSFVIWDPVTGERHKLPDVPDVFTRPAVVCAAGGGCDDHRGCSGGPFVVAFVGVENILESHYFDAHACFYASDTGEWSVHINIHLDHGRYYPDNRPATLLPREKCLGSGRNTNTNVVVMAAEGGGLGLACLCPKTGTMLYLLAREETESTVGDDDGRWVQRRVIDLKTMLPVGNLKRQPCLSGVAQDANVIF